MLCATKGQQSETVPFNKYFLIAYSKYYRVFQGFIINIRPFNIILKIDELTVQAGTIVEWTNLG